MENPVLQTIQEVVKRRSSLGAQMKKESGRRLVTGHHLQDGRSWTNTVWLSLTPQEYTNSTSAGAGVRLHQNLIFSC